MKRTVSLALLILAALAIPADSADVPFSNGKRVVHFPTDRSLGQLFTRDARLRGEFALWFHWTRVGQTEPFGEAKGEVHVPAGKHLILVLGPEARRNPSCIARLRPDDLDGIVCRNSYADRVAATDALMPHIAKLSGLKSLVMRYTNVTDTGMKHLAALKSLEELDLPTQITDRTLACLGGLTSLRRLYFDMLHGCNQVTDAGLRHVSNLTSLEELALRGERISDKGLAHLSELPRLEYLYLYGTHFGDLGMVHVRRMASLRVLVFHEGQAFISDAGLAQIAEIPNLEQLYLDARGDVTDAGLAHLRTLRSLRKLGIPKARVTDQGLAYLSQIRTLERLDLPQDQKGITDKGVICLAELPNLKQLHISRIYRTDPSADTEYYTDKALEALATCQGLEELSIGSPGITDAGMEHIARLGRLNKLLLHGCDNVTDAGLAKLTALRSLARLTIFRANITLAGLNRLKPMPRLTHVHILGLKRCGATLDVSGLTALEDLLLSMGSYSEKFEDADLRCLSGLTHLRDLQIGPRDYTDGGLASLSGLTGLQRLSIGGSHLTDDGLKHLAGMDKLYFLQVLSGFDRSKPGYVSGGNITDDGLRLLETFERLSFIEIYSDDDFSDVALRRLQQALPNLTTLRINGANLALTIPAAAR